MLHTQKKMTSFGLDFSAQIRRYLKIIEALSHCINNSVIASCELFFGIARVYYYPCLICLLNSYTEYYNVSFRYILSSVCVMYISDMPLSLSSSPVDNVQLRVELCPSTGSNPCYFRSPLSNPSLNYK